MYKPEKVYLDHLRNSRKHYISYKSGYGFAYLNFDNNNGSWLTISMECFNYMLENRLIYCVSEYTDEEYIYRLTHKGLNFHLVKD